LFICQNHYQSQYVILPSSPTATHLLPPQATERMASVTISLSCSISQGVVSATAVHLSGPFTGVVVDVDVVAGVGVGVDAGAGVAVADCVGICGGVTVAPLSPPLASTSASP
jgi:hypothetical protein